MSNKMLTSVLIFFVLTTITCGAIAFHFYRSSAKFQYLVNNHNAELVGLRRQLAQAQKASETIVRDAHVKDAQALPSFKIQQEAPPSDKNITPNSEVFSLVQNNPQVQAFLTAAMQANIDKYYFKLYKGLGLSEEKWVKFKNLILQKQVALSDITQTALAKGVDPSAPASRPTIDALRVETSTEMENNIRQELGDEKYAVYQNYTQALPQQNAVADLRQRLNETEAPLQDWQEEQLIQVLTRTRSTQNGNLIRPDAMVPISEEALNQASAFLSAHQIEMLKKMQTEHPIKKNPATNSYNLFGE